MVRRDDSLRITIEKTTGDSAPIPGIKRWETDLLLVPDKQTGYPEKTRPATKGEKCKKCPNCGDRQVAKIREHANARHLAWWMDPTAACAICKTSCGKASRLESHVKNCHPGTTEAKLSFEEWRERIVPFIMRLPRKLNLPGLQSLLKYVKENKLALDSSPVLSEGERVFHCSELDGPAPSYDPVHPKSLRDLCHWRVLLNLVRVCKIDGMNVRNFTPWHGYEYVGSKAMSTSSSGACVSGQGSKTRSEACYSRSKKDSGVSGASVPRTLTSSESSLSSHEDRRERSRTDIRGSRSDSGRYFSNRSDRSRSGRRDRSPLRQDRHSYQERSSHRQPPARRHNPQSERHNRGRDSPRFVCQICKSQLREVAYSTPGLCPECSLRSRMRQLDETAEKFMELYSNVRSLQKELGH